MNVIKTKQVLASVRIASALLAAVETSAAMRIDLGNNLNTDELNRLVAFWQQELTNVAAEVDTARRLVESAAQRGKGGKS